MIHLLADVGYQSNWLDVLRADFMRNAFIGGTLVAIASGLIGYFVVIRRDAFAAHALAHIGFPGATFAVLVGIPVTLGSRDLLRQRRARHRRARQAGRNREVSTGTILAFATGLGVLFASLASENTSTITSVLFGNLLAISTGQIRTFTALHHRARASVLVVVARPLLFASVDPQVAEAKGVPVRALGDRVHGAARARGHDGGAGRRHAPAVRARRHARPPPRSPSPRGRPPSSRSARRSASPSVWLGLVLAAMFNLPPSFCIVTLAFLAWLTTLVATRRRRSVRPGGIGGDHAHDRHQCSSRRSEPLTPP